MKDYSHIDEHVLALLNGQIDGELSQNEQQELNGLLAESAELRDIHADMVALNHFLDNVPEKTPPGYLHNAITSTVRLPLENQQMRTRRSFGTWLTEHWLGPVFALTAGVLMTVGIYETSPETFSDSDTATMSGTIIDAPATQEGKLLDRMQIENDAINGFAEVRKLGQDLLVDVLLNSTEPTEFKLDYLDVDLSFIGLASLQNQIDGMTMEEGSVSVASTGQQHYTLTFRGTHSTAVSDRLPLKVDIWVSENLVQKAELKTRN